MGKINKGGDCMEDYEGVGTLVEDPDLEGDSLEQIDNDIGKLESYIEPTPVPYPYPYPGYRSQEQEGVEGIKEFIPKISGYLGLGAIVLSLIAVAVAIKARNETLELVEENPGYENDDYEGEEEPKEEEEDYEDEPDYEDEEEVVYIDKD